MVETTIIKAILFGSLIDAIGKNQIEINNVSDIDSLKAKLLLDFPILRNYKFAIAIHNQIVKDNIKLTNGDTVALLPPFAGG